MNRSIRRVSLRLAIVSLVAVTLVTAPPAQGAVDFAHCPAGAVHVASSGGSDSSGDGGPSGPYATIAKALEEVGSGGVVCLSGGVHSADAGDAADAGVEIAPGSVVRLVGAGAASTSITRSDTQRRFVLRVREGSDVTIRDLTVDGARVLPDGSGNSSSTSFIGLLIEDSDAIVEGVTVTGVRAEALSGAQWVFGLAYQSTTATSHSLRIADSTVTDFGKNGIRIAACPALGETCDDIATSPVEDPPVFIELLRNTVLTEPTSALAQNGISLQGRRLTGTVLGNVISGFAYEPSGTQSGGISTQQVSRIDFVENTITGGTAAGSSGDGIQGSTGMFLTDADDVVVDANSFDDLAWAIWIEARNFACSQGVKVVDNEFGSFDANGVVVLGDGGDEGGCRDVTVRYNDVSGNVNPYPTLRNIQGSTAGNVESLVTLDASNNWWGQDDGPEDDEVLGPWTIVPVCASIDDCSSPSPTPRSARIPPGEAVEPETSAAETESPESPGLGVIDVASGAASILTAGGEELIPEVAFGAGELLAGESMRIAVPGLIVEALGDQGVAEQQGPVASLDGEFVSSIEADIAEGAIVEVWLFSTPRLVAAARADVAGRVDVAVPVGAPLDGGGPIEPGVHTMQLLIPTSSGLVAVNVGVTVGGPVPTSIPAGDWPSVPRGPVWLVVLAVVLLGIDLIRRMVSVASPA